MVGIGVGGMGGHLALGLVGGVALGSGEVGGVGVGRRLVGGDGRGRSGIGFGVGVPGVVGSGVLGMGRDRCGDLGVSRDRGGDVGLGQRPGMVGIGIARVGGQGPRCGRLRGRLHVGVGGPGVHSVHGRRRPRPAELTTGCRTHDDLVRQLARRGPHEVGGVGRRAATRTAAGDRDPVGSPGRGALAEVERVGRRHVPERAGRPAAGRGVIVDGRSVRRRRSRP